MTKKIPLTIKTADFISLFYNMPFMVQVETTTFCNLNCPMCEHSYSSTKSKNMSFETFEKLHKEFTSILGKKLIIYNLTGTGENLMNKDFLKMLNLCSKSSLFTYFTNNFTLLNQDVAKKFIQMRVDRVFISFDGATKETYEKMRVGAKFEKVLDNLINLIKTKKQLKSKKPEIIMRFVPTKENIEELGELIDLAKKTGVNQIDIPQFYVFEENKHLKVDDKTLNKALKSTKEKADKLGISLIIKEQKPLPVNLCKRGKYSCYVTVDGEVIPCCILAQSSDFSKNKKSYSFGNINEKSLKKIWNSKKYKDFRKDMVNGIKPEKCKHCSLFY